MKTFLTFFIVALGLELLVPINLMAQTRTPWQMHYGAPLQYLGFESASYGDSTEYIFESIPPAQDSGWGPAPDPDVIKLKEISAESPGTYYIIVSSQQPRAKSGQLASELVVKGYKDAKVLVKDNKVRVSILEVNKKSEADSALREVKKIYKDAWIYRQKAP